MKQRITHISQSFSLVWVNNFTRFLKTQIGAGALLASAAVLAMVVANTPFAAVIEQWRQLSIGMHWGDRFFSMSLIAWINDGLMALFFFLLGLEIKREFIAGELRDIRKSLVIVCAALGGMVVPALVYAAFNAYTPYAVGWGIPMATDAAFALGVLALLSRRVAPQLALFLMALAIIDDIGAVLVIAIFYTKNIDMHALVYAAALFSILLACNLRDVRSVWPYIVLGLFMWFFVHESGVHATVAGVLLAFTIPAQARMTVSHYMDKMMELLRLAPKPHDDNPTILLTDHELRDVVQTASELTRHADTPLQRWEHALQNPVSLFLLPIFAFFNAGVTLIGLDMAAVFSSPVFLGIVCGLAIGKPVGIMLFTWLAVRLHIGRLPSGIGFAQILGVGLLAGMGFTMSIFITKLSFAEGDAVMAAAKMGVLVATCITASAGMLWLIATHKRTARMAM